MGAKAIYQMTAVTSMILLQRHPTGGFWESPFAARMQGDCPQWADLRGSEAAKRCSMHQDLQIDTRSPNRPSPETASFFVRIQKCKTARTSTFSRDIRDPMPIVRCFSEEE